MIEGATIEEQSEDQERLRAMWRKASKKYHAAHPGRNYENSKRWAAKHPANHKAMIKRSNIKKYATHRESLLDRQKKYYAENRERIRTTQAILRKEMPGRYIYWSAKCRAKKAGLPFEIVESDIIIPEKCPVLGIKLEIGTKTTHEASPSLDKIIPSLGYVKGNIAIISHRANRIKMNATAAELRSIADYIDKHTKCSE